MREIATYARTAYAQGWAASGGPMTSRVQAGCIAAIGYAVDHADDPQVLEVTMHLGHLEGTWALVYDRRDHLHASHLAAVVAAWRDTTRGLDIPAAIVDYQRRIGESDSDDQQRRDAALVAMVWLLRGLRYGTADPAVGGLIEALAVALRDADAEGYAGAVMVSADQAGVLGLAYDRVLQQAMQDVGGPGNYWHEAVNVLHNLTDTTARDAARRLVGSADPNVANLVADAIRGSDDLAPRGVSALLDLFVGRSYTRGAMRWYHNNAVENVSVITVGDGRVCAACERAEAGSPYPISQPPDVPLHPLCRCATVTDTAIDKSAFSPYLESED